MKPDPRFLRQPREFWANVRLIGESVGYTDRGRGCVRALSVAEVVAAFRRLELDPKHVVDTRGRPSALGAALLGYFEHRARVLNEHVHPRLMDLAAARAEFHRLKRELHPRCPIPLNKQKGAKKGPALLTGMVNMLIEANSRGMPCDFDPRRLTTITRNHAPLRTMARRVDGAFPSVVNPVAVWEIKEYYHTTTFGSRVADGIYETLLDGMEIEELRRETSIEVKHYLMVDARYTWWDCGKSFLCRIIDMLHMGYVDEVLFGREVIERLPRLVKEWRQIVRTQPRGL